jgi:transcriptional regulator with XRE-family HTH domain
MPRERLHLLPQHQRLLSGLGESVRLARLRRGLSAQMVAERAGISRSTLQALEKGSTGCSLGALFQVLMVLGLEQDLAAVARDDAFGRRLQDAGLAQTRRRAPKLPPPQKS